MAWKRGQPKLKTGGRKKGTPNKRTMEFLRILEEEGFCPTRALISTYRKALKEYRRADELANLIMEKEWMADPGKRTPRDLHSRAATFLGVAEKAASELMQYSQPKRKAIEFKPAGNDDETAGGVLIFMPSNGREAKRKAS